MGFTLKALRVNAGLDQREAAERLNIRPETLSNWERAITFPNVKQITQIEKLYHVNYSDIIFLPNNVGESDKNEGET